LRCKAVALSEINYYFFAVGSYVSLSNLEWIYIQQFCLNCDHCTSLKRPHDLVMISVRKLVY